MSCSKNVGSYLRIRLKGTFIQRTKEKQNVDEDQISFGTAVNVSRAKDLARQTQGVMILVKKVGFISLV